MKIYHLRRTQTLPISLDEAWQFFSSPRNLAAITPPHMRFKILHVSGQPGIYAGQIICYRLFVLPFVPMRWTTEITHVSEPNYFVDVQLFGPYSLWHHQHFFKEVPGGVEVIDEVSYAIPLGILGRLANHFFVRHELNRIFDFRFKTLATMFKPVKTKEVA